MKMCSLILALLPLLAFAAEYEFLTPYAVVIKGNKNNPAGAISTQYYGRWKKENALLRDKNGKILRKPDVTYYQYFVFNEPFRAGEKRYIGTVQVQYDPDKPSNIFKLNQVGNGADQKKKFAYMGAWLGSRGALLLKHLSGKEFELRRSSDGKCVYKNSLKLRREDPKYQEDSPFTGEEVLELDYSEFNVPGRYYFFVENIGRSIDFTIGSESINEAFYIHARGLYHKRCGMAKAQPFTAWEAPACHAEVIRGNFPGNAEHYHKGKDKDFGFFDFKGKNRIGVRHFDLIKEQLTGAQKVTAPGGWHDAADYDRRSYHLRIVSDLAMVYLMKPENFIDGQLNIPESGNGIPDILDEAAWGLKHLIAVQQKDGGVGTWFETSSHPGPGEGLPDKDTRTYFISQASCNGTLEYAATAAVLALAMKHAGADAEAARYLASAEKAWKFALNKKNRHVAWFRLNKKLVSYMEEPFLYGEHLLKAGAALRILTGNPQYLEPVLEAQERILKNFGRYFWKGSALSWMVLELYQLDELKKFHDEYRKKILHEADVMLNDQENAYPYRTLWRKPYDPWVHTMGWGNHHPLRRAKTLIAAHKLTGSAEYLNGAYLANDFHNGANPLGRSMTSGLGKIYPVVFLDLVSYNGKFREFVPGITPYGNTFGVDRNAVKMVYFQSAEKLPIFRRHINLEFLSVPASEYSVWETIAPAAVTSGYLIEKPSLPPAVLKNRKPAGDFRKLPGYRALP